MNRDSWLVIFDSIQDSQITNPELRTTNLTKNKKSGKNLVVID